MRLRDFIVEGFKEVEAKFIASGADPQEVAQTIQKFRDLVNRNQITGNERNIDWWGKNSSFGEFNKFVQQKTIGTSKTQVKRSKNVGRSITIHEEDDWFIVVPLDKDASCFHGKNTDWCTTKHQHSYFEKYFYDRNIILIYCINKKTGAKWAIADYQDVEFPSEESMDEDELEEYNNIRDNGWAEFFDQQDQSMSRKEFEQETGLDSEDVQGMAIEHLPAIRGRIKSRQDKLSTVDQKIRQRQVDRDPELESDIIDVDDDRAAYHYVSKLGNQGMDVGGLPFNLLMLAARNPMYDSILQWIENPDAKIAELSMANQKNGVDILANKDVIDPKVAVKIPANKATKEIVEKLIAKNALTDQVRKNFATTEKGLAAMRDAGVEIAPEDVELLHANSIKGATAGYALYDIASMMMSYGQLPTPTMIDRIAEIAKTDRDGVKQLILDRIQGSIEYEQKTINTIQEKIKNSQNWIEEHQNKLAQDEELFKELHGRDGLSYSEQRMYGNLKYNINFIKDQIPRYEQMIQEYQKSLESKQNKIRSMNDLYKKFETQGY